tara:strand:- start:1375 stop:1548 length:174 start_codon:yes stop_codon:yes gene_type:complete
MKIQELFYKEKAENMNFDIDVQHQIHQAAIAGLQFMGFEDNEPQFMGTKQQWDAYEY